MRKRGIGALILLILLGLGFIAVNLTIFDRITLIDARCQRRVGEELFTPANFYFIDNDFDTTPYFMPDYTLVDFSSRDGVELSGFFIPAPSITPITTQTIIVVHGFNDCKRRPFSLLPAGMLHRNGFNVLVIDLRNHGDSAVTNARMTAGIDEAQDVLGAWDWLVNQRDIPPEQIGLMGYSLGGATILHAMAQEPRIASAWSDSAFDDISNVLRNELRKASLPEGLVASVWGIGQTLYNIDLTRSSPQALIPQLNRPIYLVHSRADDLVPVASIDTLSQAVASETWLTDNAIHVQVMIDDASTYEARMVDFFRETLAP